MATLAQLAVFCSVYILHVAEIRCILFDTRGELPLLLTTWPYEGAVHAGWDALSTNAGSAVDAVEATRNYCDLHQCRRSVGFGWDAMSINGGSAVDAVEATGNYCDLHQCRRSVGFGSKPDESGETTLDAMIMDGVTHNVGGVGALRRVKRAISVARKVLENTAHTLLVGDQATQFAVEMGFTEESLTSNFSHQRWESWKQGHCQPNFRENVSPDPRSSCGPCTPTSPVTTRRTVRHAGDQTVDSDNHDTIGIIAISQDGKVAAGTTTNGLRFKVPGRVGDSPIPGAGSYADGDVGAATCTGNGDIMMRFLPSYQAVSLMGTGMSPTQAAKQAIDSILRKYPDFDGAVVAANKQGKYGAACHKWDDFAITVRSSSFSVATVFNITCH